MKRILIAIIFVVGLSGAAQAKTTYLKCGLVSIAINVKDKKLIQSNIMDKIDTIDELFIELQGKSGQYLIQINRISLQYLYYYSGGSRKGTCQMGRKL